MDSKQPEEPLQGVRRSQRIQNKKQGRDFDGIYTNPTLNWTTKEQTVVQQTIDEISKYKRFIKVEILPNGFIKLPNIPFAPTIHDLRAKNADTHLLPPHYSLPLKDGRFWKHQLIGSSAKREEIRTNHTCLFIGGNHYINRMNEMAANADKNELKVMDWHSFVLNLLKNSGIHEVVCPNQKLYFCLLLFLTGFVGYFLSFFFVCFFVWRAKGTAWYQNSSYHQRL